MKTKDRIKEYRRRRDADLVERHDEEMAPATQTEERNEPNTTMNTTLNTTMKVAGAFLLGTAIGTVTGLLVAPSSGRKTKKMVERQARKYVREGQALADKYVEDFRKAYNKRLDSYVENGTSALKSAKEAVKL